MVKPNFVIPVNPDLGSQAQAVCNDIGLDIVTVIDHILRQIVHNKDAVSFEAVLINLTNITPSAHPVQLVETNETKEEALLRLYDTADDSLFDFSKVKGTGKPVIYGGWDGKARIADDFNTPIDDFYTPTNSPEERRGIVDSLIGTLDDIPFIDCSMTQPDAPRNWELMDE